MVGYTILIATKQQVQYKTNRISEIRITNDFDIYLVFVLSDRMKAFLYYISNLV